MEFNIPHIRIADDGITRLGESSIQPTNVISINGNRTQA